MASCCQNSKISSDEYKKLVNRLNRIEGQVRGVKNLLEKNAHCIDILIQTHAVNSAINSFNKELLSEHMRTCLVHDIEEGNTNAVDDVLDIIKKLMK